MFRPIIQTSAAVRRSALRRITDVCQTSGYHGRESSEDCKVGPILEYRTKAEIGIDAADELYREIRIENTLTDNKGRQVELKQGARVDVMVEAESSETIRKVN